MSTQTFKFTSRGLIWVGGLGQQLPPQVRCREIVNLVKAFGHRPHKHLIRETQV